MVAGAGRLRESWPSASLPALVSRPCLGWQAFAPDWLFEMADRTSGTAVVFCRSRAKAALIMRHARQVTLDDQRVGRLGRIEAQSRGSLLRGAKLPGGARRARARASVWTHGTGGDTSTAIRVARRRLAQPTRHLLPRWRGRVASMKILGGFASPGQPRGKDALLERTLMPHRGVRQRSETPCRQARTDAR